MIHRPLKYLKSIINRWVVCNSEYSVDDPTFLCERCLRNTHYKDKEAVNAENRDDSQATQGNDETKPEKIFDFKAYHFSQL